MCRSRIVLFENNTTFLILNMILSKKLNATLFYIMYAISRTAPYRKIQLSVLVLKIKVAHVAYVEVCPSNVADLFPKTDVYNSFTLYFAKLTS